MKAIQIDLMGGNETLKSFADGVLEKYPEVRFLSIFCREL